jgi:hypothetical protein
MRGLLEAMNLTDEALSLLRRIDQMGPADDVDPIPTNLSLADETGRTPDEVREILDPYDGLYLRAISRYEDTLPDAPSGVRYQLTEEGRLLE